MNQKSLGWCIFAAGLAMILTLLAGDISHLNNWSEARDPTFVAGVFTHIAAVITAGLGGNLVPNFFKNGSNIVSQQKLADLNQKGT